VKENKTAVVDFAPQLPTMSTHITIRPLPVETFCFEMGMLCPISMHW